MRVVSALSLTSTICASPAASIWVRPASSPLILFGRQRCLAEQQRLRGRRYIVLAHQALADEEGIDAESLQPLAILMREDAAFADQQPVVRHHGRELFADGEADFECSEI